MMILQQVKPELRKDCRRIKQVLWQNGIDESLISCRCIWDGISYFQFKSSWHPLPESDEELFKIICENAQICD
jgi:hypothetical protein